MTPSSSHVILVMQLLQLLPELLRGGFFNGASPVLLIQTLQGLRIPNEIP